MVVQALILFSMELLVLHYYHKERRRYESKLVQSRQSDVWLGKARYGMAAGEEQQSYQDFKFPDEIDMKRCYLWQMV